MRTTIFLLLVLVAISGCKDKRAAPRKAPSRVAVPKQVVTFLGVRSPNQTIEGAMALAGRFMQLPVGRGQLLALLAQRAKLPSDLIAAVDTARSFWFVGLAEGSVTDREAATIVVPIRSQDQLRKALEKQMKVAKKEGDLLTYQPKPGSKGLVPVKLMFSDNNAIIVSGAATLAATRAFVLGNLIPSPPEHDIELHLRLERLAELKGFQRQLGMLLGRVQEKVERGQGSRRVAMATTDTVRDYIKTLLTAQELVVSLDVTGKLLKVGLAGQAKPGGRLAEIIKRQRPGKPLGVERLPPETWLLLADRGNPGALKEQSDLITRAIDIAFPEDDKKREQLTPMRGLLTGDLTVGVHHAADAKAMAVSVIAGIRPDKQKQASATVASMFELIEAQLRNLSAKKNKGEITSHDFRHGQAIGKVYRAPVQAPTEASPLIGDALELGWAVSQQLLLIAAGRDAAEELTHLVDGRKSNLAGYAPFSAALKRSDQVGVLYLSLVEMVRAFAASGIEGSSDFVADLKDAKVTAAPMLTWSVDAKRQRFVGSLELPAEHFIHFKPFLSAVAKRTRSFGRPQEVD